MWGEMEDEMIIEEIQPGDDEEEAESSGEEDEEKAAAAGGGVEDMDEDEKEEDDEAGLKTPGEGYADIFFKSAKSMDLF